MRHSGGLLRTAGLLMSLEKYCRGVAVVASVFSIVAGSRLKLRELQPSPAPLVVGVAYYRRRLGPAARQFVRTLTDLKASG